MGNSPFHFGSEKSFQSPGAVFTRALLQMIVWMLPKYATHHPDGSFVFALIWAAGVHD
jgi:hypothetical protein